ncbi:MAG: glycerophosphodiester phosphodiesterase family protein [Bacteroidota bacterium]|nr:glycerophosphodiester phosphodiesterase family protein [Bacteroidota bacterium]
MEFCKILLLITLILPGNSIFSVAQPRRTALPVLKHRFVVIAHRGEHLDAPENTMASTKGAIAAGADFVEVDLRTTKDSALVILHDATVDRTTNGHGLISTLTLAEIQPLCTRNARNGSFTHEGIPSFEAILAACRNKINIYLDFKDADAAKAYALIRKYKMERHTIVYINTPAQFTEWRGVAPAMPLMVSLPDSVRTPESLHQYLHRTPCSILDGNWNAYTPELIKAALQNKVAVWPDIQSHDELANWPAALRLGFGGLQTDHPSHLIKWLHRKGIR